ncbi:PREDICTED: tetraspanin-8-like [Branchiostoma belcheri]|uniref:Tetraspanin n=1 Tax=Branchiostoma belcheri TaxID=7741 RepID=A0A6P4Y9Z7_BRABE|nr:PREDICTED: tetraspanin-8-like [Branchiostoma belcheri]
MAEGLGMNCVKYLLFFFNFLFWVAGLFLVGVGIWIRVDDNALKILHNLDNLDETVVYAGCYAFIGVGAVALVVGFFGCCGAVMENKCLLGTFFACLFVLLIAEVGVAIYAVVKKPDAEKFLKEGLDKIAEKKYQDLDPELQRLVDFFQKEFKCCGMNSTTDWAPDYPDTCNCTAGDTCDATSGRWKKPCDEEVINNLNKNIVYIGGGALGVALIMVLGIILSCMLFRHGRREGHGQRPGGYFGSTYKEFV